ncbi:hypothetical protein AUK40_02770 [Candidatus Wirthbacteria bacterium CG2_30_54_11]|uniref:indole-3-glycerol-phosphate synthase n=1 Tax=Candidatus Wirthbacteria bacterium CG2_30_54_11 TaxID=1817892 RepID=A0A1J5J2C0_9BACT|nr:MAG: hypothetical protein AUK40_02770 [Candidatus Wirthbacteria bacterium CG2_30_54_11]
MNQPDILKKITDRTREDLSEQKSKVPLAELKARLEDHDTPVSNLLETLQDQKKRNCMGLIAEYKNTSPSAGQLDEQSDPDRIFQAYAKSAADALSIVTEPHFFHGDLGLLTRAHTHTTKPLLRKDFIVDEYQVYESRLLGADAILLISRILSAGHLDELQSLAHSLGMSCLVEAHDENDIRQIIDSDAPLAGINTRNLTDFTVDLAMFERLAPLFPSETLLVALSGISTPEDVSRVRTAGAHAVLVGTSLMKSSDIGNSIHTLKAVP